MTPSQKQAVRRLDPVYIRFKKAKVDRTVRQVRRGMICAVDLDAMGAVVGVELIGMEVRK